MTSLYVIVSSDRISIHEQVEHIFKSVKDIERISYDLTETPIERVVEDLDTYNFFSARKGIVAYNASFLSSERTKGEVEHNLSSFEKYIENPNPENILVLVTDSLDKRKKLVTTITQKATVLDKEVSLKDLLKKRLDGYQMDSRTIDFLIEYCGSNNEKVLMELEKLKIYKDETKEITISDIKEVVVRNLEDNIFTLVDAILKGDKQKSFRMYQDLLLQGEQSSSVVSKLANKIRLIYQVKVLVKEGNTDQQMGKLLGMHPYPVKLARESSYKYSESLLLEYLEKLAKVDYDMKSGSSVASLAFEVFMASI